MADGPPANAPGRGPDAPADALPRPASEPSAPPAETQHPPAEAAAPKAAGGSASPLRAPSPPKTAASGSPQKAPSAAVAAAAGTNGETHGDGEKPNGGTAADKVDSESEDEIDGEPIVSRNRGDEASPAEGAGDAPNGHATGHACAVCGKTCATLLGLKSHERQVHNVRPCAELIDDALQALGGSATQKEICRYIETHAPQFVSGNASWMKAVTTNLHKSFNRSEGSSSVRMWFARPRKSGTEDSDFDLTAAFGCNSCGRALNSKDALRAHAIVCGGKAVDHGMNGKGVPAVKGGGHRPDTWAREDGGDANGEDTDDEMEQDHDDSAEYPGNNARKRKRPSGRLWGTSCDWHRQMHQRCPEDCPDRVKNAGVRPGTPKPLDGSTGDMPAAALPFAGVGSSSRETVHCEHCGAMFSSRLALANHVSGAKCRADAARPASAGVNGQQPTAGAGPVPTIECPKCGRMFTRPSALARHSGSAQCVAGLSGQEGAESESDSELADGPEELHGGEPVRCPTCGLLCKSERGLNRHRQFGCSPKADSAPRAAAAPELDHRSADDEDDVSRAAGLKTYRAVIEASLARLSGRGTHEQICDDIAKHEPEWCKSRHGTWRNSTHSVLCSNFMALPDFKPKVYVPLDHFKQQQQLQARYMLTADQRLELRSMEMDGAHRPDPDPVMQQQQQHHHHHHQHQQQSGHAIANSDERYVCHCGRVFPNGQALGGHRRYCNQRRADFSALASASASVSAPLSTTLAPFLAIEDAAPPPPPTPPGLILAIDEKPANLEARPAGAAPASPSDSSDSERRYPFRAPNGVHVPSPTPAAPSAAASATPAVATAAPPKKRKAEPSDADTDTKKRPASRPASSSSSSSHRRGSQDGMALAAPSVDSKSVFGPSFWTEAEVRRLVTAVKEYGLQAWPAVADAVRTRSLRDCQVRFAALQAVGSSSWVGPAMPSSLPNHVEYEAVMIDDIVYRVGMSARFQAPDQHTCNYFIGVITALREDSEGSRTVESLWFWRPQEVDPSPLDSSPNAVFLSHIIDRNQLQSILRPIEVLTKAEFDLLLQARGAAPDPSRVVYCNSFYNPAAKQFVPLSEDAFSLQLRTLAYQKAAAEVVVPGAIPQKPPLLHRLGHWWNNLGRLLPSQRGLGPL